MATEVNKKHLNSRQFFFSANSLDFSALRFKVPKNQRGEPFEKKNLKKNRFLCLIPQKNHLKKCRLAVKSVFENIDFWGSY